MAEMTPDELANLRDELYLRGKHATLRFTLQWVLGQLGYELGSDSPERKLAEMVLEREEAIAQLRSLCEDFGDNAWTNELHLADVIDYHLGRHLHANREEAR